MKKYLSGDLAAAVIVALVTGLCGFTIPFMLQFGWIVSLFAAGIVGFLFGALVYRAFTGEDGPSDRWPKG